MKNISNEQHHAHPAVSASGLKLIDRSPAHYWARYRDLNRAPSSSTPAMEMGTAIHSAVLEPKDFEANYVQKPEGMSFATKEGKAWKAALPDELKILTTDEYHAATNIASIAMKNKKFSSLVNNPLAEAEKSLFFSFIIKNESEEGAEIECKIRPDLSVLPCNEYPNGIIIDVKSTEDARSLEFGRSIMKYQMLIQAAFYVDGFQAVYETESAPEFAWFAFEKLPPYANKLYFATEAMLDYGREEYKRLLAVYVECDKSGVWPAYGDDPEDADLPEWAWKIIEGDNEKVEIVYE